MSSRLAALREVRQVCQMFGIVFICAKLLGWEPVADWSWWLVGTPLIIPFAIFIVFAIVTSLIMRAWEAEQPHNTNRPHGTKEKR